MFSYKEARKYTKENINGNRAQILGYYILYIFFKGIISGVISSRLDGALGILIFAVVAGIVAPINVGLFRIMTSIVNKEKVNFSMLFDDYKYFTKLFVLGTVGNLIIKVAYSKIFILGFLCSLIYVGFLYFFIYNSDLSLEDLFTKGFAKVKDFFAECILLELSYSWIAVLATIIYIIVGFFILTSLTFNFVDLIKEGFKIEQFLTIINSALPIMISTAIYVIFLVIYVVMVIPSILFAEAKFYSAMKNVENKKVNFCPKCGAKVKEKFCSKCGNKLT